MADPEEAVRAMFSNPLDMVRLVGGDPAAASEPLRAIAAPDIEFEFVGSPGSETNLSALEGTHRGADALLRAWREWLDAYSSYTVELLAVHPLDERSVLAEVEARAHTATGDVEVRQRQAALFEFREGRLSRWQAWLHADDAKGAFGVG
jgi:ketosteroid isomerase-like protein